MTEFDTNVAVVLDTMTQFGYSPVIINRCKKFYSNLKTALLDNGYDSFSKDFSDIWCATLGGSKSARSLNYLCVCRLSDVYECGRVLCSHINISGALSDRFRDEIDGFQHEMLSKGSCKDTYVHALINANTLFCRFCEINGVYSLCDICHDLIDKYYSYFNETGGSYNYYIYYVEKFLEYGAWRGECKVSLSLYLHYLKTGKCIHLNEMSPKTQLLIEQHRRESQQFPSDEFFRSIPGFINSLRLYNYSKSRLRGFAYHLNTFLIFSDMESLGYDRQIADIWLEEIGASIFGPSCIRSVRRTFDLFDTYINEGDVIPSTRKLQGSKTYDKLPGWCKTEIDDFIKSKVKEGRPKGTVNNYRCSTVKFCIFLENQGLRAFCELTPELIKEYNIQDRHSTLKGKNKHNFCVRQFMIHLEMKQVLTLGTHLALPSTGAKDERIIETLNDEDRAKLEGYCKDAKSPLELRDAAILSILMNSGLRPSDIAALKKNNIDWKGRIINFTQQKTEKEHSHYVGAETLNAVYKYLQYGRYKKPDCDYLFLSSMAPYEPVTGGVCKGAMRRAGLSIISPRIIRKTYASDMLRSGATISQTAELLGHSDDSSVHNYTLLDDDRMQKCPLSIAETGLDIEEGRYN